MNSILIISLVTYIVGCFISYFIFCYMTAKKNYNTGKYRADIDESHFFGVAFWPFLVLFLAVIAPFKLIEKFAMSIKEMANRDRINANSLTKNCK